MSEPIEIYHYKLEDGSYKSFSLLKEHGRKWNLFCQRIMMNRKDKPHPDFDDYMKFMEDIYPTTSGKAKLIEQPINLNQIFSDVAKACNKIINE